MSEYIAKASIEPRDYRMVFLIQINIHPLSGWFFIFGHSPNTTSHAHVRIYWPASHALNYLLPVNGSLGSNRLN